tara:strand:+ start:1180 stop:2661 length:1482 start_codon:yes stop_codon:yes gene_type:complete
MFVATFTRLFIIKETNNFIEKIRHNLCSRLMGKFILGKYNPNLDTSSIAKSILSEIDQFIVIVFQPVMLMITNAILLFGIIIYLSITNFRASLISIFLLFTFYIIFYIFTKKILNEQGFKSEESNQGRFKTAIESLNSIKELKIYTAENYFLKRFKKNSKLFAESNALYSTLISSPKYLLEMMVFVSLSLSILILAYRNQISLDTIPLLGTFAFAAYKAQPALSNVIYGINSLEYGSKIINNLHFEIKSYEEEKLLKKKSNQINKKVSEVSNTKKGIKIKDLNFLYKNNLVLSNINLFIKHPSFFVIAGKSGSGKSTLLNILSGLQMPHSGEISFCLGVSEKNKPTISFLNQEYYLYDSTISENIAFGIDKENIDFTLLKKVSKDAGIFDYINSLDNKFEENVGENGNKLSIGQKQRIALARALYFKPNVLLLDEPTSGLDKRNEEKIIETITELSKKITVIMSTHKLNSLARNIEVGFLQDNQIKIKKIGEF